MLSRMDSYNFLRQVTANSPSSIKTCNHKMNQSLTPTSSIHCQKFKRQNLILKFSRNLNNQAYAKTNQKLIRKI